MIDENQVIKEGLQNEKRHRINAEQEVSNLRH